MHQNANRLRLPTAKELLLPVPHAVLEYGRCFTDGIAILPSSTATAGDSRALARLLCAGAQGFLVAAEATHERHLHEPADPEHWPAITVNLCFALELSLKAFIALHGGNRQTLKKIGHNLVRGLAEARATGYSPKHQAVPDLIAILSPLHVDHSLRYLENGSAILPEMRDMIAIVRCHVSDVGSKIAVANLNLMQKP